MRRKRARLALCSAALPVLALALALPATSNIAGADTVQNNGCFLNASSTFTQFAVPITGTGTPDPDALPNPITLSGVSIAISVDSALISAGIAVGVVSAALDESPTFPNNLRNIGFVDNTNTPSGSAGISVVTAAPGAVTLKIAGTNTVEGAQTATNLSVVSVTFYVTAQADGSNPLVYTSVTNGTPNQAAPDDTRTGTLLVGNLSVPIPLAGHKADPNSAAGTGTNVAGDTVWTPVAAGTVDFSEVDTAPDNALTPTVASQGTAPIQINTRINNFLQVNFRCWPGTVDDTQDPSPWVDGPSNVIDSVTVTGGATTTTTAPTTTTTAPGTTTTTVAPTTTTTAPGTTTTTAPGTTTTTAPGTTTTTVEPPTCSDPLTACVVWGQLGSFSTNAANNGGVSANSLHLPWGVAVDGAGNLYVADVGNNRVLYYPAGSTTASRVYGQGGDFTASTANNGGVSANSLWAPWGVVLDAGGNLYVADYGNNRVLFYPAGSTTATRVYGQGGSFVTNTPNKGGISADSLNAPWTLALDSGGNLYVADNSNSRVLYYPSGSTTATRVYGQGGSFVTNTPSNGGITANSLRFPSGLGLDSGGNLFVADTNNTRVLYYPSGSTTAIRVYGQGGSFATANVNNGGINANSLAYPYGLAINTSNDLIVSDNSNSRILLYPSGSTTATRVYGQAGSFTTGIGNNGGVSAASIDGAGGLGLDGSGHLYAADHFNNRVLRYP